MYGAFIGDMIGAPYEFDRGNKSKDFPLFTEESQFTDDSVMTAAVCEALMDTFGRSDDDIKAALVASMQKWGRRYPDAGYGARFIGWIQQIPLDLKGDSFKSIRRRASEKKSVKNQSTVIK